MTDLICELRPDGSGCWCCSELAGKTALPDDPPEVAEYKRFYWDGKAMRDTKYFEAERVTCPFCHAPISPYREKEEPPCEE